MPSINSIDIQVVGIFNLTLIGGWRGGKFGSAIILAFAGELHTDKLFLTTDDILWYAAEGKIYCYDLTRKRLSKTLTVESKVQSIINGNNGLIYVATWTKGLYVFDREGILKEHLTAAVGEKLRYDWIICAVLSRNSLLYCTTINLRRMCSAILNHLRPPLYNLWYWRLLIRAGSHLQYND